MHRYDPNAAQSAALLEQKRRALRQDVTYGVISVSGILAVAYICAAIYWRF